MTPTGSPEHFDDKTQFAGFSFSSIDPDATQTGSTEKIDVQPVSPSPDLQSNASETRKKSKDPSRQKDDRLKADCWSSQQSRMSQTAEKPQRYSRQAELGRGGYGVVERAFDHNLEREVAVKRIHSSRKIPAEIRQRFLYEAKITSQLQHPGIVPVHELVVDDGDQNAFYVMKLLEGESLRECIFKRHQLDPETGEISRPETPHELFELVAPLLERFIDICQTIGYAHERLVVHRDLKPANVMTGRFGETVVVDWGLALQLENPNASVTFEATVAGGAEPDSSSSTKRSTWFSETDGTIVGTPAYMSPEQARGELTSLTPASDIYALGAILWDIVVGDHPYRGQPAEQILAQVTSATRPDVRSLQPNTPNPMVAILDKALALRPEDRYATAGDLADDVRLFLVSEPPSVYRESWIEKSVRWCRRNEAFAMSIALATVLLLVGAIVFGAFVNAARHAEYKAKIQAYVAHESAFERLVESRMAADHWLIDLSGALEFYPGMEPVRKKLLQDAIQQYEVIVSGWDEETALAAGKLKAKMKLENARCHIRLGDLYFLLDDPKLSRNNFETASSLLKSLGEQESTRRMDNVVDASKLSFIDWVQLEQANATMGLLIHADSNKSQAPSLRELRKWLGLYVPDEEEMLRSDFRAESDREFRVKAVSAAARLALIEFRHAAPDSDIARMRMRRAATWARWLTQVSPSAKHRQLYQTAQSTLAEILESQNETKSAQTAWNQLVADMETWSDRHSRPDMLQALAHARIQALQQETSSQKRANGYRQAITELNDAWSQLDSDSFFRSNLAIAELGLGQTLTQGQPDPEKRETAHSILHQSLATWQELLREQVTIDRLRKLAETHVALADLIAADPESAQDDFKRRRSHFNSAQLAYQMMLDHQGLSIQDGFHWIRLRNQWKRTAPKSDEPDRGFENLIRWMKAQDLDAELQKQLESQLLDGTSSPDLRASDENRQE